MDPEYKDILKMIPLSSFSYEEMLPFIKDIILDPINIQEEDSSENLLNELVEQIQLKKI